MCRQTGSRAYLPSGPGGTILHGGVKSIPLRRHHVGLGLPALSRRDRCARPRRCNGCHTTPTVDFGTGLDFGQTSEPRNSIGVSTSPNAPLAATQRMYLTQHVSGVAVARIWIRGTQPIPDSKRSAVQRLPGVTSTRSVDEPSLRTHPDARVGTDHSTILIGCASGRGIRSPIPLENGRHGR